MTKVVELYGCPTNQSLLWNEIVLEQNCPFLSRKCLKNRKSEPDITIGTCTVSYGRAAQNIIICPFRLLERREFSFEHIQEARLGDPMQFHAYELLAETGSYRIQLNKRWSTDANGIAQCLGLQTSPRVELEAMLRQIEDRLPQSILLSVGQPLPVSTHEDVADDS